jgi:hypothetical protein
MPAPLMPNVLQVPAAIPGQGLLRFEACGHDELGRFTIHGERQAGELPHLRPAAAALG